MLTFEAFNTNLLIAMLRSLTHEIDRAHTRLYAADIGDEESEALGLYRQDLLMSRSLLGEEYERRQMDALGELTALDQLIAHFSSASDTLL
jgi:hypothetical protein